jgi:small-conductance mechanosensitive channel
VPPLAFARLASGRLTPRKDVVATTKLLIGLLLVVVGYALAISLIAWKIGGWTALVIALLLPLSGWATLRVLDRLRLVRRGLGVLFRRLAFRREVRALRAERDQLVASVIATVSAVKPASVEAMFPPDHPDRIEESSRARRDADLDAELDKREGT